MSDQPSVDSGPLTFDLPCLGCGYNLRGLSGDPLRCPECGRLNLVRGDDIPESLVQRELRRMEKIPALCVAFALLALQPVAYGVGAFGSGEPARELLRSAGACLGLPLLFFLCCWLIAVAEFRRSCLGQPGWARALWRYHMLGVGAGALMLVGLFAVSVPLWPPSRDPSLSYVVTLIVGFGACLFFIRYVVSRAHAPIAKRVRELQREVAVARLRQAARDRAERARRGR